MSDRRLDIWFYVTADYFSKMATTVFLIPYTVCSVTLPFCPVEFKSSPFDSGLALVTYIESVEYRSILGDFQG